MGLRLSLFSKYTSLIVILFVLLIIIVRAIYQPIGDFGNYYYAARFMLEGNWGLWIYDPTSFNLSIYDLGQKDFFLNFTSLTPLTTIFFLPFAIFKISISKIIWNVFSVGLLLASISSMHRHFSAKLNVNFYFLFAFLLAILTNINHGQAYFLLLFLIWFGYKNYIDNNKGYAAILWALAFHLKIIPGLLILLFIFKKDLKGLLYFILASIALVFISAPLIGLDVWFNYIIHILPKLQQGYINDPFAVSYQSFDVLFRKLFVYDEILNPTPLYQDSYLFSSLSLFVKLIFVLSIGLYCLKESEIKKQLGLITIGMLIISGYGNSFSMVLLSIPLMVILYDSTIGSAQKVVYLIFTLSCSLLPYYWFSTLPIFFQFIRLFGITTVFVLYLTFTTHKIYSKAYLLAFLVFFLPKKQVITNTNAIDKNPPSILAYDFEISKEEITILYFSQNGIITKKMKPPIQIISIQEKILNKKKEVIVNGNQIIYLSDKGRGVGFNNLVSETIE